MQARQILHAVLVVPAGLGDEALRLAPHGAGAERRRPFADRPGHQHVVAEVLELIAQPFLQLGKGGVVLVLQEVHLQTDGRLAVAMHRDPRVVHPVLIEVRQDLIRVQRAGSGEEHLIKMCGQAERRRIRHRLRGAAQLVIEGLHAPHVVQRAGRGTAARKSRWRDGAIVRDRNLLDVGMDRRRGVHFIEQLLAQTVGDRRAGESLVEQHRSIGDGLVQLAARRATALRPLVRDPAAHRGDPLAVRNVLAPRRQRLLDLADRIRVLEDGVVAGPVGEADDVDVRLDQSRERPCGRRGRSCAGSGCCGVRCRPPR